eukprot:Gb_16457 [translate_table: standard]
MSSYKVSFLEFLTLKTLRDEWEVSLVAVCMEAMAMAVAGGVWKRSKVKLPPGPVSLPIFGNWLQVGNDLNHRNLSEMAKKYGDVFMLRMGWRNVVVVWNPEMAKEVLHTQGVEFGSRNRNVVFDIFTGKGQDMVFTVYGDHWRKMRRIMTLPFFTNKVVQQYRQGDLQRRRLAFFDDYFIQERKKLLASKGGDKQHKCAIDHILDVEKKGEISAENVLDRNISVVNGVGPGRGSEPSICSKEDEDGGG